MICNNAKPLLAKSIIVVKRNCIVMAGKLERFENKSMVQRSKRGLLDSFDLITFVYHISDFKNEIHVVQVY